MVARRKGITPSPYRQEQDAWDRALWKATGLAIGQWLLDARINLSRPIRSLTADELTGMSWAAIGTYNDMRYQREQELENRSDQLQSAQSSDTDLNI